MQDFFVLRRRRIDYFKRLSPADEGVDNYHKYTYDDKGKGAAAAHA
jgi:hypothetical protein